MKEVKINIDPSVKSLFADEALVACTIRQDKDEKGNFCKEGKVELIFVENPGQRAVARIVMPKNTVKSLGKIIGKEIEKHEKELANKGEIKKPVSVQDTSERRAYIG